MDAAAARRHLIEQDPKLGEVIERVGPYRFVPDVSMTPFGSVVRSIVYQQLSGKAAGTIFGRLKGLHADQVPPPEVLLEIPDATLREIGLSRQKVAYLRDLARRVVAGDLPIETMPELDDEVIISALTQVKGIGRWTAQMFLMFRLGRPDVLPDLDLAIQKATMLAHGLPEMPSPQQVRAIGARWAPYRSMASWYLWRSLDTALPAG